VELCWRIVGGALARRDAHLTLQARRRQALPFLFDLWISCLTLQQFITCLTLILLRRRTGAYGTILALWRCPRQHARGRNNHRAYYTTALAFSQFRSRSFLVAALLTRPYIPHVPSLYLSTVGGSRMMRVSPGATPPPGGATRATSSRAYSNSNLRAAVLRRGDVDGAAWYAQKSRTWRTTCSRINASVPLCACAGTEKSARWPFLPHGAPFCTAAPRWCARLRTRLPLTLCLFYFCALRKRHARASNCSTVQREEAVRGTPPAAAALPCARQKRRDRACACRALLALNARHACQLAWGLRGQHLERIWAGRQLCLLAWP